MIVVAESSRMVVTQDVKLPELRGSNWKGNYWRFPNPLLRLNTRTRSLTQLYPLRLERRFEREVYFKAALHGVDLRPDIAPCIRKL